MASSPEFTTPTPDSDQWECPVCNKPISQDRPPVLNLDNCSCPDTATSSIETDSIDLDDHTQEPHLPTSDFNSPSIMSAPSAQSSSYFLPISPTQDFYDSEESTAGLPLTLHRYLCSQPQEDPAMLAPVEKDNILPQGVFEVTGSMCATGKGSLEGSMESSRGSLKTLGISGEIVGVGGWANNERMPENIQKFEGED